MGAFFVISVIFCLSLCHKKTSFLVPTLKIKYKFNNMKPNNFIKEQVAKSLDENPQSKYVYLHYVDNDSFEDYNLDEYEVANEAEKIAKNEGVTILRDKNLTGILLDVENKKVIGGLWVSDDSEKFSFDIAIDSDYQNMGLSNTLIKNAISEYRFQKEAYEDGEFKIEVDVINPKLAQILKNKYGFYVVSEISPTRVLMSMD